MMMKMPEIGAMEYTRLRGMPSRAENSRLAETASLKPPMVMTKIASSRIRLSMATSRAVSVSYTHLDVYKRQPLTLEEVAGYCNLSPTYFSRKFRLITGQTFKEHVNYIRLRQATQMLLMTDNSITKIAMLCGFGSSNYFKDLFRASTGRSPREYRKHSGLPIHPHLRDNG